MNHNGEWTLEVEQKRPKLGQNEDEIGAVFPGTGMSPDVQSVVRIRSEIMMLNPAVHCNYSPEDMLVRFGEVREELRVTFRPSLTEVKTKQRANSTLLLDCARVARAQQEWDQDGK
jgi:hypothetical protein